MILRPTRRQLITGAAATAAGLTLPRPLGAATATDERKFIIVQALGGWDITSLFAPIFGSTYVEHAEGSDTASYSGLEWVTHANRPSVDAFFQRWGDTTAFLNGVYVASIAHPSALRFMLTSSLDTSAADWATRIAAYSKADHVLPHLVIGGAYFAGPYGVHVGRSGSAGQLQGLASGEILTYSDMPVALPTLDRANGVDVWLAEASTRAAARATGTGRKALLGAYDKALERSRSVREMANDLDFTGNESFTSQLEIAVRALELGVSRCVTVAHPQRDAQMSYDSHAINDLTTSVLLESLFSELDRLMDMLATTTSPSGAPLADETVVVVMSEMARSPTYNGSDGRDHWPCTSAMILGSGVNGGRMYGGWNEEMYGQQIDLSSGDVAEGGEWLAPEHLGATLLALADVDPADTGVVVDPIAGMLA
jgi:uncharacterized protein (DUF1501 family)